MLTILVLLSAFAVVGERQQVTHAQPAKPAVDWSLYILNTSPSQAYQLGCGQGQWDTQNGRKNSLVVLAFGKQRFSGSVEGTEQVDPSNTFMSYSTIKTYAQEFARGYYICTGSNLTSVLRVALTTSNYAFGGRVDYGSGQSWGNVIMAVRNYVGSQRWNTQVMIVGGSDIEPSWSGATAAKEWVNGFNAATVAGVEMINYGSADGCPPTVYNNASCANSWRQYDVWYVSRGASRTRVLPQIYRTDGYMARQWSMISRYAANYQGGKIFFLGPLDQNDSRLSPPNPNTNSSQQAWNQLWTEINRYSETASGLTFSCQIHYNTEV